MIKVKELISYIAVFLVLAVALTLYVAMRPKAAVQSPTFVYEEVVVHKAAAVKTFVQPKVIAQSQPAKPANLPLPIVPPRVISQVWPEYPVSALEKGIEGLVLVQAYINVSGQPEKVEVKTTSGNVDLDEAAVKAMLNWRFAPATENGSGLASWFEVPVRFSIKLWPYNP